MWVTKSCGNTYIYIKHNVVSLSDYYFISNLSFQKVFPWIHPVTCQLTGQPYYTSWLTIMWHIWKEIYIHSAWHLSLCQHQQPGAASLGLIEIPIKYKKTVVTNILIICWENWNHATWNSTLNTKIANRIVLFIDRFFRTILLVSWYLSQSFTWRSGSRG